MISLIVGLGNVGSKYEGTRHNLGFEVVNLAAKKLKARRLKTSGTYESFSKGIGNTKLILARPTTMMNGSGQAVRELLRKYKVMPSEVLIVIDDFNIPLGSLRLRANSSAGGHNGLSSIIGELETNEIPRLRLGIGLVPRGVDVIEFVLKRFKSSELKIVNKMIEMAAEAVIFAAGHRFEVTMSKFNYNPA